MSRCQITVFGGADQNRCKSLNRDSRFCGLCFGCSRRRFFVGEILFFDNSVSNSWNDFFNDLWSMRWKERGKVCTWALRTTSLPSTRGVCGWAAVGCNVGCFVLFLCKWPSLLYSLSVCASDDHCFPSSYSLFAALILQFGFEVSLFLLLGLFFDALWNVFRERKMLGGPCFRISDRGSRCEHEEDSDRLSVDSALRGLLLYNSMTIWQVVTMFSCLWTLEAWAPFIVSKTTFQLPS